MCPWPKGAVEMPGLWKAWKAKGGLPTLSTSPLEISQRQRDSHIPTAPTTTAMEKWKSKSRISTFPPRLAISQKVKKRGRLRLFSLHPTKNGRSPAHWINLQLSHQDSSSEEISHSTAG